jgi:hypothetical protein
MRICGTDPVTPSAQPCHFRAVPWRKSSCGHRQNHLPRSVDNIKNRPLHTALQVAMECFAREEDKAFIAQARDDVPALLAEVRRLREQVAQLQARQKPEPPG